MISPLLEDHSMKCGAATVECKFHMHELRCRCVQINAKKRHAGCVGGRTRPLMYLPLQSNHCASLMEEEEDESADGDAHS